MLQILGYIGVFVAGVAFGILLIGLMAANDEKKKGDPEE